MVELGTALPRSRMPIQQLLFDLPPVANDKPIRFAPVRNKIWTEQKAKLISRYLHLFVLITKHGTYIDGFAGPQYEDKKDAWTAKQVLESEPRWLKSFFLCDLEKTQIDELKDLVDEQPKRPRRHIEIHQGDFNSEVKSILTSDKINDRIATFCLLDQRTFECDWATVTALAATKSTEKIELMYFVPTGWFGRAVAGIKKDKDARMERWWGRKDWERLLDMNLEERAQAFCERFKSDLGYKYASRWPIYSREQGRGRTMYHLIHATDHRAAPYLMGRAYRTATKAPPPQEQLRLEFLELEKALGGSAVD